MDIEAVKYTGRRKVNIRALSCGCDFDGDLKLYAAEEMGRIMDEVYEYQDRLFAEKSEGLVVVIQGMDASGKDGVTRHIMKGLNPEAARSYSFKAPTQAELAHDYMWRVIPCLPERGMISVLNRSYYEDVLIVQVHELYLKQNLPKRCLDDIIKKRYAQINTFEKYLWENGIRVVKILLNISKEEQAKRLLKRVQDPAKNWKFSPADVEERKFWERYIDAHDDAINATATETAPWYILPADKKPAARLYAANILLDTLKKIDPKYPATPEDKLREFRECARGLTGERT